ncbi:hypothetical protein Goari_004768 [Gossypium aridum]|uniref:Mitochondrial carrier protein n=1 Tax=Gossypium aridum TaxID=34290 RepID=A0A7J8Y607_GOSAI|nr:hypothetical protein [Gossypium aridum]
MTADATRPYGRLCDSLSLLETTWARETGWVWGVTPSVFLPSPFLLTYQEVELTVKKEVGKEVSTKPSGYKEYVAGLLACVATVIVGHPFDTVKVKLQKHNTEVEGIKYRNGLHCTVRILATDRACFLIAFISISTTPFHLNKHMCLSNPIKILASLIYACRPLPLAFLTSRGELMFKFGRGGVQSSGPQPQVIIPSAAFGGAIISFVLCPSELVKLNMDSSDPHNLTDVGIGILTGGLDGVAFWSAVLPLDVAKTVIQTATDKSCQRNPFQVLNSIYRRTGVRGCYAGLGLTIVRAFPANSARGEYSIESNRKFSS